MSSSSHSPCAACKFLRRKCTQECVFAPYFPPDQPVKFANVHKVYGASNVAKLLNELNVSQREDAVTSLAYEAEARLQDPVYGCVAFISVLHSKLKQVQSELLSAKKELATYIGPQAMMIPPYNVSSFQPMLGMPPGPPPHNGGVVIREPASLPQQQQQQLFEARQQQSNLRFNGGFDMPVNAVAFGNQMGVSDTISVSMGLDSGFDNSYQMQRQQSAMQEYQLQAQLLLQSQQPQQSHHISEGDDN